MLINITEKLQGKKEVDILITNGKVFNVFTMEFMEVDILIDKGMIIGFGHGVAKEVINASGKYIIPGLIDSHMHIESTMLRPIEYSKVALANGVTTAFADCHEIANVLGSDGIDFMLCEAERAHIDLNMMLPSSVPCSKISNDNTELKAADIAPYYDDPFVYGLAEVMDYSRVEDNDLDYTKKIKDCIRRNLTVDGHMAGLTTKQVDLLRNHGVSNDHECETAQDLLERITRGVNVFIREGSAAKNFTELMEAVTIENNSMISFCSDDISIVDLVEKGSINNIIRIGIKQGYDPKLLIKMATYNAARAYNLRDKGAIAPGYVADLLLIDDIEEFSIKNVFKDGIEMSEKIDFMKIESKVKKDEVFKAININVDVEKLNLKPKHNIAIEMINGSLVTGKHYMNPGEEETLNKIIVINRYGKKDYFVGYIKGMDLGEEVIASTVSHDYHNIVVIGKDDAKLKKMISHLKKTKGGIFATTNNQIINCELEIAGLMSNQTIDRTYNNFKQLLSTVENSEIEEPFLAMSFMTLDVIPHLKITDRGLFDFESHCLIN